MPSYFFHKISGMLYGPKEVTERWDGSDTQRKTYDSVVAGKDDEDYLEKTWIFVRWNAVAASFALIADVISFNNKGGIVNVLQRAKYHYTPWVGGAIAYTTTVRMMSSLRGGKTDRNNHMAGGLAAGAVLGKCTKSVLTGFLTGAGFAVLAYWYKDADMRGYELLPNMYDWNMHSTLRGNPFSHKTDFTTNHFEPRPGYWARSEADVERVFKQGQLGDGDYKRKLW